MLVLNLLENSKTDEAKNLLFCISKFDYEYSKAIALRVLDKILENNYNIDLILEFKKITEVYGKDFAYLKVYKEACEKAKRLKKIPSFYNCENFNK